MQQQNLRATMILRFVVDLAVSFTADTALRPVKLLIRQIAEIFCCRGLADFAGVRCTSTPPRRMARTRLTYYAMLNTCTRPGEHQGDVISGYRGAWSWASLACCRPSR
jgi:hypothetical protein